MISLWLCFCREVREERGLCKSLTSSSIWIYIPLIFLQVATFTHNLRWMTFNWITAYFFCFLGLVYVFAKRWERKGAYDLLVVCRRPAVSRWLWVVATAKASRAKQRELRGEASGWQEARGESERERERVKGYERE